MSTLPLLCVLGLVTFTSATLTLQAPCPNNFFYDALYDLENLTVCPSPHVTEYKPITTPSTDCKCCARGTLNISLSASASRRGLLVDLWFDDPSTWAFNLGDSKSNNGWKGDSGHSSYDAEIHNTNASSFIIYRNDQFNAVPAADKYHKVDNSFSRRLSLVVKDGAVQWVSDVALGQLVDVGLFGLDGQYDAEAGGPADYNLYLGLNQVVNGGRKGRGLCKAGIRFLCEYKETQTTKTTTTTTRRPKPTWKPVRKIPQRFSPFRDLSQLG